LFAYATSSGGRPLQELVRRCKNSLSTMMLIGNGPSKREIDWRLGNRCKTTRLPALRLNKVGDFALRQKIVIARSVATKQSNRTIEIWIASLRLQRQILCFQRITAATFITYIFARSRFEPPLVSDIALAFCSRRQSSVLRKHFPFAYSLLVGRCPVLSARRIAHVLLIGLIDRY